MSEIRAMTSCRLVALRQAGYKGAFPDMWWDHLKLEMSSKLPRMDLEKLFLAEAGYADKHLGDLWFEWLGGIGYDHLNTLADRWRAYWCDVANLDPGDPNNPGLPSNLLLDARFDYYAGILDQALTNNQVLGPTQGAQAGKLTVQFGNGSASIAGGQLTLNRNTEDCVIYGTDAVPRARGVWSKNRFVVSAAARAYCGVAQEGNPVIIENGVQFYSDDLIYAFETGVAFVAIGGFTDGAVYETLVVLDTAGAYYYVRGGPEYPEWTLLHVGVTASSANVRCSLGRIEASGQSIDGFQQSDFGSDASVLLDVRGAELVGLWSITNDTNNRGSVNGNAVTAGEPTGANCWFENAGPVMEVDKWYEAKLDSNMTGGVCSVILNGTTLISLDVNNNGSHSFALKATTADKFEMRFLNLGVGTVSNMSLKEIIAPESSKTPGDNITPVSGWEITSDDDGRGVLDKTGGGAFTATEAGSNSLIFDILSVIPSVDTLYQWEFDCDMVDGTCFISTAGAGFTVTSADNGRVVREQYVPVKDGSTLFAPRVQFFATAVGTIRNLTLRPIAVSNPIDQLSGDFISASFGPPDQIALSATSVLREPEGVQVGQLDVQWGGGPPSAIIDKGVLENTHGTGGEYYYFPKERPRSVGQWVKITNAIRGANGNVFCSLAATEEANKNGSAEIWVDDLGFLQTTAVQNIQNAGAATSIDLLVIMSQIPPGGPVGQGEAYYYAKLPGVSGWEDWTLAAVGNVADWSDIAGQMCLGKTPAAPGSVVSVDGFDYGSDASHILDAGQPLTEDLSKWKLSSANESDGSVYNLNGNVLELTAGSAGYVAVEYPKMQLSAGKIRLHIPLFTASNLLRLRVIGDVGGSVISEFIESFSGGSYTGIFDLPADDNYQFLFLCQGGVGETAEITDPLWSTFVVDGNAIDALSGDIVSADFATNADGDPVTGETLTIVNPEELHDDYPAAGVGKIRRGTLIQLPAGGESVLAGGVATGSVSAGWTGLGELAGTTGESGYSGKSRVAPDGVLGGNMIPLSLSNNQGQGLYWRFNLSAGGPAIGCEVSGKTTPYIPTSIDLADPNLFVEYQITGGAFDDQGQPDPDGKHGALFIVNGVPIFSDDSLPVEIPLFAAERSNRVDMKCDYIQTKIDKGVLRTPQRALFKGTVADAADYVPEDGANFNFTAGRLKVENNKLTNILAAQGGLGIVRNPGGYFWEFAVTPSGTTHFGRLYFKYLDGDNSLFLEVVNEVASDVRLKKLIGGVESNIVLWTSGNPTGKSAARFIVSVSGTEVTVIFPETGDVWTQDVPDMPAGDGCGLYWNGGNVNNAFGIDWFAARQGTVEEWTP